MPCLTDRFIVSGQALRSWMTWRSSRRSAGRRGRCWRRWRGSRQTGAPARGAAISVMAPRVSSCRPAWEGGVQRPRPSAPRRRGSSSCAVARARSCRGFVRGRSSPPRASCRSTGRVGRVRRSLSTASKVLETPEAKAQAARFGALIVDMESGAVAAVARRRGAAFQALRVVLDEADQRLPRAVLAIDDAGEVRLAATLARLTPRPWCWPEIARLARQRAIAERRLRTALGVLLGGGLDVLGLAPAPPVERRVTG